MSGPALAPALAIVLARGGSKGLPDKNARLCAGRPLLAWTLAHALGSASVGRVVLSTDEPRYADIARSFDAPGAARVSVVMRPAALASDGASVVAAAAHAASEVDAAAEFDAVAILYGNVPVRPADLTDRAVAKLRETGCDSVQSVSDVGKHHPYWMKRLEGDRLLPHVENQVHRRQDLPPLYELDGGALVVRRSALAASASVSAGPHAFLGEDRRAVVNAPGSVVDVDTAADLRMAEAVLSEAILSEAGLSEAILSDAARRGARR